MQRYDKPREVPNKTEVFIGRFAQPACDGMALFGAF